LLTKRVLKVIELVNDFDDFAIELKNFILKIRHLIPNDALYAVNANKLLPGGSLPMREVITDRSQVSQTVTHQLILF
jgi:hypothetical protein